MKRGKKTAIGATNHCEHAVQRRESGSTREEHSAMANAASVVMRQLAVDERDSCVVVCNPAHNGLSELADAVLEAARTCTTRASVCEYVDGERDGQEPPAAVAAAMRGASAIVLLTRFSISHTRARMQASEEGARIASMPGITRQAFARALPADYEQLRRDGRALAAKLNAAHCCRVTSPAGTDLTLSLAGRVAISDDGDLGTAGAFGNLPAGETYTAPLESGTFGTIVFDGSLADWGLLDAPVTVAVQRGRITNAAGGEAGQWLLETLDAGGPNGRVLAELGIGTNPSAKLSGVVLEDEKANGTIHFAFGNNAGFGGINEAAVHIDALVLHPRVELDGTTIVDDGRRL